MEKSENREKSETKVNKGENSIKTKVHKCGKCEKKIKPSENEKT